MWYYLAVPLILCIGVSLAMEEPFVTTYPGQNVDLIWITSGSSIPLRNYYQIQAVSTQLYLICYTNPFIRCDNHGVRSGELTTIPTTALHNTSIPVSAIGAILENVTISDANDYRMYAHPHWFSEGVIYIFHKPQQPCIRHKQQPLLGQDITFQCNTTSLSVPTRYNYRFALAYVWEVQNLASSYSQNLSYVTIQNVQKSDIGARISCHAQEENSTLVSDESPVLTLDVYYLEDIHFSDGLDQQEILEGSKVTKTCQASCNPECQYQWVDDDGAVIALGHSIIIENISEANSDVAYNCRANNTVGTMMRSFRIVVVYRPEIVEFHISPTPTYEGNYTALSCTVKNNSVVDISIASIGSGKLIDKQSTMILEYTWQAIDCTLNGDYECRAENKHAVANHTLRMDVKCPPRIDKGVSTIRKLETKLGSRYHFAIDIIANPFPCTDDMTLEYLTHSGEQIRLPNDAFLIDITGNTISLNSPHVTENDYGLYSLSAQNVYGHMVVLFEVVDPRPNGAVVGLSVVLALVLAAGLVLGSMWYFRNKIFVKKPDKGTTTKGNHPVYENAAFGSAQAQEATNEPYESLGPDQQIPAPESTYQIMSCPVAYSTDTRDPINYEDVNMEDRYI